MNLTQVRDQFPITRGYAYLNHASVGGLSKPVVGAMTRYLTERGQSGSEALTNWDADIERVRQACARFVGAHRDEIVFTGSISHGLNIVACGIDWRDGDNLICAETEFTANIYPWTNLQRRGVEVRFAPARENRILVEDVASLMDRRTRLVAISFVEFQSGYRNDLNALAALCHARGAYLCVDGIQGLGALQFSVAQTPVDFVAAHAAKWMLGPIGAGFLYVRRSLIAGSGPGDGRLAQCSRSRRLFQVRLPAARKRRALRAWIAQLCRAAGNGGRHRAPSLGGSWTRSRHAF